MLELVRSLIGGCPAGLEFLEYVFAFFLVAFGVFVVAYLCHLPFEFIANRFHKKL